MTRISMCCALALCLWACAGTKKKVDDAHEDFKRDVRPAAKVVDEKTREVVDEGNKDAKKVAYTLSGDADEDGD